MEGRLCVQHRSSYSGAVPHPQSLALAQHAPLHGHDFPFPAVQVLFRDIFDTVAASFGVATPATMMISAKTLMINFFIYCSSIE